MSLRGDAVSDGATVRRGGGAVVRRGDTVELTIESIAFGGAGVGRVLVDASGKGGMAVFVDGTVPGDKVRVRIGAKKRRYLVGYVEEFLERSERRVEPRCKHFGTCGGCSLQSLSYEDQLRLKEQHMRDAFGRIGGFGLADVVRGADEVNREVSDGGQVLADGQKGQVVGAVEMRPILGCEEPWYYRNKMELSFSRTLDGRLDLGLHVKRRHHDVIELTECFLMSEYVGDFVSVVREFFRTHEPKVSAVPAVPRGEAERLPLPAVFLVGEMKPLSLVVREGKYTGEILVNLIYENGVPEFLDEFVQVVREFFHEWDAKGEVYGAEARAFAVNGASDSDGSDGSPLKSSLKKLKSIYFTNTLNKKGSPKRVEEKLLWGEAVIRDDLRVAGQSLKFEISPQAFFQPNTRQAGVLYGEVLKAAALTGTETVFDLFCGAGTIGSFCASSALRVVGIEMNASAIEDARRNAELNGIKNIEFFCGDVGKLLEEMNRTGQNSDPVTDSTDSPSGDHDFRSPNSLFKPKNKVESVHVNSKVQQNEQTGKSVRSHKKAQYISNNINLADLDSKEQGHSVFKTPCLPDVVIVDPPRSGLTPQALELTAALQAKRIVYVSCNPVTQARDAALLKKHGYVLQYVQPVDMFPHTWHIEGVALFTC